VSPETRLWAEIGWGTVLVDGFTAARWKLEREKDAATLRVESFRKLSRADRAEIAEEGARLIAFLAEETTTRNVRFADRRS
jgi:hypothetical protein